MGKKRSPTEEEEKLWKLITKDVKRLKPAHLPEPVTEKPQAKKPKKITLQKIIIPTPTPKRSAHTNKNVAPGLDHHSEKRLRTGDYPIDATLDLHGFTRDQAFLRWQSFFQKQLQNDARCLLVITGKGTRGSDGLGERGILRELFPKWLMLEETKPWILRCIQAKPQHGGSGAFYVLLKRKRQ